MTKIIRLKNKESINYQAIAINSDRKDFETAFLLGQELNSKFFAQEIKIILKNNQIEDSLHGYIAEIQNSNMFLFQIPIKYSKDFLGSKSKLFNFLLINLSPSATTESIQDLKKQLNFFSFIILSFVVSVNNLELKFTNEP